MSKTFGGLICVAIIPLLLVGCGEQQPEETAEAVRPVKTYMVTAPGSMAVRVFPGVIDANQKVDLSFRVSGILKQLPAKEGDIVEKGQIIAQLDRTDLEIVARDRRARYQEAKANFLRAEKLLPDGHISKADHDRLYSTYQSADAALATARQDLAYTDLKAPFAGQVAQRLVQNFEEIQAKQTIVELQDLSSLEVKIDIPEGDVRRLREESYRPKVSAVFGDKTFELKLKEYSAVADSQTQTFRVTLAMERPTNHIILPGMTTSVTVDMSDTHMSNVAYMVPTAAIFGDINQNPRVWVVDEMSMTVKSQQVTAGEMHGNTIEVIEGLEEGQRVVIAGIAFLVDGMKVRLLPKIEQAEPFTEPAAATK